MSRISKRNPRNLFFDWLMRIVLIISGLITFLPFVYVVALSLLSTDEYSVRGLAVPRQPSLENYIMFFKWGTKILDAYKASLFITIIGTLVAVCVTAGLAYGLAHQDLPGRNKINGLLVFTMFFGGGMIPTYMVIKTLGLLNTYWSIILPGALSVWNTMLMKTFFANLPKELEESAVIDGANDFQIAFRVMFPLCKASFATIALFYAVAYWNEWYSALLYLNDARMYPLQMALRDIIANNEAALDTAKMASGLMHANPPASTVVKMTAIVITIGPILVIYPFVQKYFVKGAMVGSIKG